jgi:ATP-dependent Clp protease ATP-binding subunit ClpA
MASDPEATGSGKGPDEAAAQPATVGRIHSTDDDRQRFDDLRALGIADDLLIRLTARAGKVLVHARDEARRFNHNYLGTEHLLLGLLRETEGVGALTLNGLGIELDVARDEVERVIGRGDAPSDQQPPTPRTKRVLEIAAAEAKELGHVHVGTEHILLGLVREGQGIAAGILEKLGADLKSVRAQIVALLKKDNVITCRINGRDLEALDMLVEAGIRSTRSDAAAWLIHAGITANRPLFDRVRTTIDDIRRLRREARDLARDLAAAPSEGG